MDSSNRNPDPHIANQPNNPLQFAVNQSNSSVPNSNSLQSPNFGQNTSSLADSIQNHFLSAPIPRGKRRGRPRNVGSSSNQVQPFSSLAIGGNMSNVGFDSSSVQVNKVHAEGLHNLIPKKYAGASRNSGNLAKKSYDDASEEIIVINKEATAEALIALTAGFPGDSLTEEEKDFEVVSEVDGIEQVNYILIRNHIIAKWRENVSRWVTKEMFLDVVPNRCATLLDSAYNYLVSHGYVNFGVAPAIKERISVDPSKPKVIVIGAGLAGLAAARQMMAFGFNVIVLEGRKRAGGRVYTMKLSGEGGRRIGFADLGGSVLTGTLGNPLGILARQLSCKLHKVREKCPLYKADGTPVDPIVDKKVEDGFNELLDMVSWHRKSMEEISQNISLGAALTTYRKPLNEEEMSLFNWHLANLEYANAGLLSRLSLAFWDQDDPYDMGGDHCFLNGGNGRLIQALLENVPILFEKNVHAIRYGNEGVQVAAGGQIYKGDMVLCTVPLGVLKTGAISFIPELPQRKLDGIKRLGFGLLNKVAMLFPHAFWGTDLDTFGHLSDDPRRRGEFFLFYSYVTVAGGPILIGLVAGEAAHSFEAMEPTAAVARVLRVLRGIYEPQGIDVPDPLQAVCTRWGSDPFSCGSYSNVAVGASGDDYDILAESVGDGRLFFAGEATTRRYPATMHGALLSGFREAANMAFFARARAVGLKVEKDPSKNAHMCASTLADLFRMPDVEFGSFALIFGRRNSDSMAILRVTFGGQRKKPDQHCSNKLLFEQLQSHFNQQDETHVYTLLTKQQALDLREVRGGDNARFNYLSEKLGVKLVGRNGLGPSADSVIASIKADRSEKTTSSGKSESKVASTKRKLIRKAKIMGSGNGSSSQKSAASDKEIGSVVNVSSTTQGNINQSTSASSDAGIRSTSSNTDTTRNSCSGAELIGPFPQKFGLNNGSTTPFSTHTGLAALSSKSSLAPPDSCSGKMFVNDIRVVNQSLSLINSSVAPESSKNGTRDISITDTFSQTFNVGTDLEAYNSNCNGEVVGSSNSLLAPSSSEISTSVFQSNSSMPPPSSNSSSIISQNCVGDVPDSIHENIFEDIMNELLPSSSTNSGTWQFTQ